MKILQLIPNLSGGGAERFTVDLSNQLATEHDIFVLTLFDPEKNDLFRKMLVDNIKKYSISKEFGFDYKIFRKLYKVIKQIEPDIIHCHLRSINYLIPISPLLDIPVVYTVHNDAFKDCSNSTIRNFRRLFFKYQTAVPVTISQKSQQSFQKAYKGTYSELIYNGRVFPDKTKQYSSVVRKLEELKLNKKTRIFVHIGRHSPQKNQLMLVEAFNRLVYKDNTNAILLIIGGGRNTDESRKITQELRHAEQEHERIHVLGERSNATDYLHAADYFCLSSLYEGMPISLIEAFATGCIPVCTPVGGMSEMVGDLDPALLSDSVRVSNYYQLLKKMISLPERKTGQLKENTSKLFEEKYSIKYSAIKYHKLYKCIL